jgi:hypothetical protein
MKWLVYSLIHHHAVQTPAVSVLLRISAMKKFHPKPIESECMFQQGAQLIGKDIEVRETLVSMMSFCQETCFFLS